MLGHFDQPVFTNIHRGLINEGGRMMGAFSEIAGGLIWEMEEDGF